MQKFVIDKYSANRRIDKILREKYPNLPQSFMYKAFRKKDIKVNGIRVKENYIANPGDIVEVYIIDEILYGNGSSQPFNHTKAFTVVYEDKNILIVNKMQGIPVHPDKDSTENTLIDLVTDYIRSNADSTDSKSFTPALCHRLDRNTGGLVIIAKNNEALKIMLEKIRKKEIKKYYQCIVRGIPEKNSATLKAFLEKDERKSRVYINSYKTKNSLEIITKYKTLSVIENLTANEKGSLLEVELITGRTHQIRAHMAYIGHPIVGDSKYGDNNLNRALKLKYQALWAYKIKFEFSKTSGILSYLNGKKFEIEPNFSNIIHPYKNV
ncbi:RluA family pseudouridine synthase [Acetivibrio clariflavus]|uniref:RluA family pseudouridine synthase n=1 Tax=Acetivibrio clariflavus TaxID=288965 RepID=UPI000489DE1A|nr:RluA family pseudouridine synthase [Acetivibrio clariflavus]